MKIKRLFCYGTLQEIAVFRRITGGSPTYQPARLIGFRRYRVASADYPAIVPAPLHELDVSCVEGCLVEHVTLQTIKRLDSFEGELYERVVVKVDLVDPSTMSAQFVDGYVHVVDAWVYVLKPRYRNRLTKEPWDIGEYRDKFIKRLLR